jgi:hypothetical protein
MRKLTLASLLLVAIRVLAQAPIFSPTPGTFFPSTTVSISCPIGGQSAAYTLDGSSPNIASTAYAGPLNVTSTTIIKAICANIQTNNQNTQTSMGNIPGTGIGYKCVTSTAHTYGTLSCETGGGVTGLPSNVALTFGTEATYTQSTTASTGETQSLIPYFGVGCDPCDHEAQDFWIKTDQGSTFIANLEMDLITYNHTFGKNRQGGLQCNQQSGTRQWQVDTGAGTGWINTGITDNCPFPVNTYVHIASMGHWTNGDTGCGGNGCYTYDRLTINGVDHDLTFLGGQPTANSTNRAIFGNQKQMDQTNTVASGHNPTTSTWTMKLNNVAGAVGAISSVTSGTYTIAPAVGTPTLIQGKIKISGKVVVK